MNLLEIRFSNYFFSVSLMELLLIVSDFVWPGWLGDFLGGLNVDCSALIKNNYIYNYICLKLMDVPSWHGTIQLGDVPLAVRFLYSATNIIKSVMAGFLKKSKVWESLISGHLFCMAKTRMLDIATSNNIILTLPLSQAQSTVRNWHLFSHLFSSIPITWSYQWKRLPCRLYKRL